MSIKNILAGALLLTATACSEAPSDKSSGPDGSASFQSLLNDHWQNALSEKVYFRKDPDAFRMEGSLPSFSKASRDRRKAFNETVLTRLATIDEGSLSDADKVSFKLFKYEREAERASYEQPLHFFPFNALFGFHSYFAEAPAKMGFLSEEDYDQYMVSLANYPRYTDEFIVNLKQAVDKGYTHYCESLKGYEGTISRNIVSDVTKSDFYPPIAGFPVTISPEKQAVYSTKITNLITQTVIPEYQKLYDYFMNDYMANCRENVGINTLEGGADYYKYLLNFYTTTDMTPQQIHDLGLSEVKRIRAEMDAIISSVGFKGDFKSFLNSLRENPENYADGPQDLLEKAAYISKQMEGELPKWFTKLPRTTYNIKASPGGSAYYVASAGDGMTPGTYYIGANSYLHEPLYNLEALTFHEGVPGHHLQSSIAQELDVPEFRKSLYHSAYGEGWGLYSESLGKEAGFYKDAYSDFGRLTYEMWRACRLVVDTGMHAFGWSRREAIDYLLSNTALSEKEVADQIDRYITWPAQATSYKIGELRIKALRNKAQAELGDKFDIRRFHDTVIGNGSLPIAVLDEIVGEWIEAEK